MLEPALSDRRRNVGKFAALAGRGQGHVCDARGVSAELPDEVCVKIEPDAYEESLLFAYSSYFAQHPEARAALCANAWAFVETCHTLPDVADAYLDFLRAVQNGGAASKSYLKPFSAAPLARGPLPGESVRAHISCYQHSSPLYLRTSGVTNWHTATTSWG